MRGLKNALYACPEVKIKTFDVNIVKTILEGLQLYQNILEMILPTIMAYDEIGLSPVNTKSFYNKESKGYCLIVDGLVSEKGTVLAVKAFKHMPGKQLIIKEPLETYLKILVEEALQE